ncbi:hypothetical protein [Mesorhizobium sp. SP-1A]|uniref:hypothetical protein n=1 Tax=Mesorhizobium sp. SP-1A TaxID=3077840 RepID=UPI0028F6F13B|nr:hypothetical protein [Mesorhizobium sp. SP-1A]
MLPSHFEAAPVPRRALAPEPPGCGGRRHPEGAKDRRFLPAFWLAGFLHDERIHGLKSSAISEILIEQTFNMM